MADIPRLNAAIAALENGGTAFVGWGALEIGAAQALAASAFDAVLIDFEHTPFDVGALRNALHYMLDRRQILTSGSLAPAVAPLVRIPPNGGEMNQWVAKQVLDNGAYGVMWPHVSTVEEARNAVAACRYSRPPGSARFVPAGKRGDGPRAAARYWGLTMPEYYERADVWPLDPQGEILVGIQCEERVAIDNLPDILAQVPGIGVVMIGDGDLSHDLGVRHQFEHPTLLSAMAEILAICKQFDVPCGRPRCDVNNVERLVAEGYRWMIPAQTTGSAALELGRRAAGRTTRG